jgi:hypothetical protein
VLRGQLPSSTGHRLSSGLAICQGRDHGCNAPFAISFVRGVRFEFGARLLLLLDVNASKTAQLPPCRARIIRREGFNADPEFYCAERAIPVYSQLIGKQTSVRSQYQYCGDHGGFMRRRF